MRQIVLDTETTGLKPEDGHRIVEIGCVEIINRTITGKTFQTYLDPEREPDEETLKITGLTSEFLKGKPKFIDIVDDFLNFIAGAELIIHNAPFDLGFLNNELKLINHARRIVNQEVSIFDTLILARRKHPGQKNNLDALCTRYNIDNSHREYHGALLDAKILAKLYLAMTAGQTSFDLGDKVEEEIYKIPGCQQGKFKVIKAHEEELKQHEAYLKILKTASGGACLWEE